MQNKLCSLKSDDFKEQSLFFNYFSIFRFVNYY